MAEERISETGTVRGGEEKVRIVGKRRAKVETVGRWTSEARAGGG